jgi:uncharacterized membrane protein HdeD (DUF308 family)
MKDGLTDQPKGGLTNQPRNSNRRASALNVLAGVWLLVSPWVLGTFWAPIAGLNALLVGGAVAILAAIRLRTPNTAILSWTNLLLGVWLFTSPFVFGFYVNSAATANAAIVGLVIAFCGLLAAYTPRSG